MKNKKIVLLSSGILFAGASLTALFGVSFLHNKEASCLEMDRSLKGGGVICFDITSERYHCLNYFPIDEPCTPTASNSAWEKLCIWGETSFRCKGSAEGVHKYCFNMGEIDCPKTRLSAKCDSDGKGGYIWKLSTERYPVPVSCGSTYYNELPLVSPLSCDPME